jgi:hypothetical protein
MADEASSAARAEILALRARVAVLERAAWLGVVMSAQLKRGATLAYLDAKRVELAEALAQGALARDLEPDERAVLGEKAEAIFRRMIAAVEEI